MGLSPRNGDLPSSIRFDHSTMPWGLVFCPKGVASALDRRAAQSPEAAGRVARGTTREGVRETEAALIGSIFMWIPSFQQLNNNGTFAFFSNSTPLATTDTMSLGTPSNNATGYVHNLTADQETKLRKL